MNTTYGLGIVGRALLKTGRAPTRPRLDSRQYQSEIGGNGQMAGGMTAGHYHVKCTHGTVFKPA